MLDSTFRGDHDKHMGIQYISGCCDCRSELSSMVPTRVHGYYP